MFSNAYTQLLNATESYFFTFVHTYGTNIIMLSILSIIISI